MDADGTGGEGAVEGTGGIDEPATTGAIEKKTDTAIARKNEAIELVANGHADGPGKLAVSVVTRWMSVAATAEVAGLVTSIAVLIFLLTTATPAHIISVAIIIAFLGGACAGDLGGRGKNRELRLRLADAHREIERKSAECAELRKLHLENPQSSQAEKQTLPAVLKELGSTKPEKPKKGREGKRR